MFLLRNRREKHPNTPLDADAAYFASQVKGSRTRRVFQDVKFLLQSKLSTTTTRRCKALRSHRLNWIFTIGDAGCAVDIDASQIGEFSWQLLHRAPGNQEGCLPPDSKRAQFLHAE